MDELECLRTNSFLLQLLAHYAALVEPDREVWQDRLNVLDGVEPADMTKLHGDLLAFGWIEWTCSPAGKKSSACYRMTSDGLRAHRMVVESKSEVAQPVFSVEKPTPRVFKRKREKMPAEELVATDA